MNQQFLQELFEYKDGNLYWKIQKGKKGKIGKQCGAKHSQGYIQTCIDKKLYLNHRLIFLYHYGYLPEFIDHIDGNKTNNCIENLREATHCENQYNRKINKNNKSGIKGVHFHQNKWLVKIRVDGKVKYFGSYHDLQVAKFVSETMRYKYHKEFAKC
jgi:hypothetical protein